MPEERLTVVQVALASAVTSVAPSVAEQVAARAFELGPASITTPSAAATAKRMQPFLSKLVLDASTRTSPL